MASIAFCASAGVPIVTKPKPRDWPEVRSVTMCTSVTSPMRAKASRTVSLVDENERLPTYRRVPMCLSLVPGGPGIALAKALTHNLSPYRPRNQEAGRGGTVRRVHTLRCRRSRAAVPLNRESSRSRGNVREPPKHNEACPGRKLGQFRAEPPGSEVRRRPSADIGEAQVIPSIYKIGFANLAGSGAGSTVSSFWRAITPPMGSLTISETTTLETL